MAPAERRSFGCCTWARLEAGWATSDPNIAVPTLREKNRPGGWNGPTRRRAQRVGRRANATG